MIFVIFSAAYYHTMTEKLQKSAKIGLNMREIIFYIISSFLITPTIIIVGGLL